jgi:hypothetical protein
VFSKLRPRRPSLGAVSAVLSCLALFFALGGVGYAKKVVKLIDGSTIKKRTISGDRLRNDTVTGKQVKESTLGTVPSSAFASIAGNANTANTANSANTTNTANTANSANTANTANTATNANHASSADFATNASHASSVDAAELPGARIQGNAGAAGCSPTATTSFNNVDYNSGVTVAQGGCTSGVGNKMTIQRAGVYLVTAGVSWSASTTGTRKLSIGNPGANGDDVATEGPPAGTGTTQQTVSELKRLTAGQDVSPRFAGSPATINDAADTFFAIQFLSP